jgi:hypothetical protein
MASAAGYPEDPEAQERSRVMEDHGQESAAV